jgi:UDP-2,3-diacylglucosamine hydrolase
VLNQFNSIQPNPRPLRAWFVSDLHILSADDSRYSRFKKFLEDRLQDGTTHLFLVGDIFDLWVGGHDFFSHRYSTVVDAIRRLVESKVEIHYFEGNHDLHLSDFWHKEIGVNVHREYQVFNFGSFRVRVEHGDQMNPEDTGYLILRKFLRTPPITWLAETLPGEVIQRIGNTMSRSSRKWTSSNFKARNENAIRKMIRAHAAKVYESQPFDLLISGHVHVQDDHQWSPRVGERARSVGLGCWLVDKPSEVLCLEPSGVSWHNISL